MKQKLSPAFESMIRAGGRMANPDEVLRLSDFFISFPGKHTPWAEPYAEAAYRSYFLPLNYARLRAAFREVRRFLPAEAVSEIWDFGSGPGTTHWVLEDEEGFAPRPLHCVERAVAAVEVHKRLMAARECAWSPDWGSRAVPAPGSLGVFSYSFLEMQDSLPDLKRFDHLLIVEPSLREISRRLQEWRKPLREQGFHLLAPCTHEDECPLLVHSQRDWCHMRIGFDAPEWWLDLEAELPMKNRTLTYSYLLVSRTIRDSKWRTPVARVIGDTLEERGKTRQMICRGPQREFVSWLHRHGEPPRVPHGALLRGLESTMEKGTELRVVPESVLEWVE